MVVPALLRLHSYAAAASRSAHAPKSRTATPEECMGVIGVGVTGVNPTGLINVLPSGVVVLGIHTWLERLSWAA